jgi:hypothetical protein
MTVAYLEWGHHPDLRRVRLGSQAVVLGPPGAALELPQAGGDRLEFSAQPPRVRFEGRGPLPECNGAACRAADLHPGDWILWHGVLVRCTGEVEAGGAGPNGSETEQRAWRRVRAGLFFELGQADPQAAKRWQQAVLDGSFDADQCAAELTQGRTWAEHDERLSARAGTLLRDWLMAPYARGIRRSLRRARSGLAALTAYLLIQVLVLGLFASLFALALVVARLRWKVSFDVWIDRAIAALPG